MKVYAVAYGLGQRAGDGLAIFSTEKAQECIDAFARAGYPLGGYIEACAIDPDVDRIVWLLENM